MMFEDFFSKRQKMYSANMHSTIPKRVIKHHLCYVLTLTLPSVTVKITVKF
jgi:hypothetical protein